jgi:heme-binding protein
MARLLGWGLRVLGVGLLVAQAFRIDRTNPPVVSDVAAPPEVAALLRRACYDCHSNETAWPWYAQVAPVSWLLAHDVGEGREEVNFSTWTAYDRAKKRKRLTQSAEEVGEGKMPPWYYLPMHSRARLTPGEQDALRRWALEEVAKLGG